ncbi:hypothetical protein ABEV74_09950 [Paenibacillus cisolokensis]|uniref:hypothetical protein n=1 Tax=Paenibacillus cisolokensis TaxID=1658519 RepID=UPI003D2B9225
MKRNMIWIPAILVLVLLSACGNGNGHSVPTGHESGSEEAHEKHAGGHGGEDTGSHVGERADNHEGEDGHGAHGEHGAHDADEQADSGRFQASFTFGGDGAEASENAELTVQITDRNGNPVNDFDLNHEKLLHLIIVNRDLSFYNHIHPDFIGDGKFTVATSFPEGGNYKLFADFVPKGEAGVTLNDWVNVKGKASGHKAVEADPELVKEVNGKQIELAISSTKPKEDATLTFTIRDAETKQGINDLEPYLGAVGHVVILSADAEQYIHVHPLDEKSTGPEAQFMTEFPAAGLYKIWGEFQHRGKVFTVPFVVEVK